MNITSDNDLLFFKKVLTHFLLSAGDPNDKYSVWDKQQTCIFLKKIKEDIAKNHNVDGENKDVDIF